MKQYRAWIFDLDGTLLNTLEDLTDSTNYALSAHGFPVRSMEEVRMFVGNGIGKLISRAVPNGTEAEVTAKVLDTFRAYYGTHCQEKTKPYDGVLSLLDALLARGVRLAVVSNKADFAVRPLVASYFGDRISVAIGEKEGVQRKPAPDTVREAMRLLQVDKTETLYIGDSDVDIETAKRAGVDCLSVLWGFRDRSFLEAHGGNAFAETPEELLAVL